MKVIKDIVYSDMKLERQKLDLYLPDTESFRILIYFHGGGMVSGDKSDLEFCPKLAEMGIAVASASYRLYPSAVYPDFIRDAAAAVAWVKNNISQFGNCTGLYVGGSSAGGYLTQMLCFDKRYLALHNIDSDMISGYIMDAGQPTVHFNVLAERGIDTHRVIVDDAAPLYHVTPGRNYPPMKILISDNDMENRYEQTYLLVSTLKACGCDMNKVDLHVMKGWSHTQYVNSFTEDGESVYAKLLLDWIICH